MAYLFAEKVSVSPHVDWNSIVPEFACQIEAQHAWVHGKPPCTMAFLSRRALLCLSSKPLDLHLFISLPSPQLKCFFLVGLECLTARKMSLFKQGNWGADGGCHSHPGAAALSVSRCSAGAGRLHGVPHINYCSAVTAPVCVKELLERLIISDKTLCDPQIESSTGV